MTSFKVYFDPKVKLPINIKRKKSLTRHMGFSCYILISLSYSLIVGQGHKKKKGKNNTQFTKYLFLA